MEHKTRFIFVQWHFLWLWWLVMKRVLIITLPGRKYGFFQPRHEMHSPSICDLFKTINFHNFLGFPPWSSFPADRWTGWKETISMLTWAKPKQTWPTLTWNTQMFQSSGYRAATMYRHLQHTDFAFKTHNFRSRFCHSLWHFPNKSADILTTHAWLLLSFITNTWTWWLKLPSTGHIARPLRKVVSRKGPQVYPHMLKLPWHLILNTLNFRSK